MQERIQKLTNDVSERWKGLNKQQQRRLALGIVGLIIAIGVTIFITTRPRMVTLYANRDAATIVQMQAALQDVGIRYNISNGGRNIEVRQEDVSQAMLEIEGRAEIFNANAGSFTLDNMLDNIGMGTPEQTRQQLSTAAQAGEIETMLRGIQGINDAIVLLNPTDTNTLFMRDALVGSATVFLSTSVDIDAMMAQTIANSVAGAVRGLTADSITIMDQNARTIFYGGEVVDSAGANMDLETQRRSEIETMVRLQLSPMFDDIRVMSNLVFNQDLATIDSFVVTSPLGPDVATGLITSQITQTAEATGTTGGLLEPGLAANDLGIPVAGLGGGGETSASSEEIHTTFTHNEMREQIQVASGNLIHNQSSMSIVAYNFQYIHEAQLRASGALDEMTWIEFQEANSAPIPMVLDEALLPSLVAGTGIDNLVISGFTLPVFIDEVTPPVNWQNVVLFGVLAAFIAMLAYGLIRRTQQEEVIEIEPELSVEDLLVTTRMEEQRIAEEEEAEAERQRLKDINYSTGSEVKTQIEKFVNEKPEAVAQLLRSWINDGWE